MFILGWSNTSFNTERKTPTSYSTREPWYDRQVIITDEKVDELIIAAQKESDDTKRTGTLQGASGSSPANIPVVPVILLKKYDNVGVRAS